MPFVSIIIPAYNAAKYLQETLDSIQQQTFRDFETIVVDDGSTDNTREVLASNAASLRVIPQANGGRGAALNRGADEAKGEWLAFVDGDDLWLPQKLERQITTCRDYVWSYTNSVFFGDDVVDKLKSSTQPQPTGQVLDHLLRGNFITGSSVLIRKDIFQKFGGFSVIRYVEDWPLWLRVAAEHEIAYIAEPLVRYRIHTASGSFALAENRRRRLEILESAFGAGGPAQHRRSIRRQALASAYRVSSLYGGLAGNWQEAWVCAMMSLSHDPFQKAAWKYLIKSSLVPCGVKF